MRIEVTQQDIDQGKKGSCKLCPIGRAIRRHFPMATVGTGDVVLNRGRADIIALPITAQDFVYRFDREMSVAPFSFELEVPGED